MEKRINSEIRKDIGNIKASFGTVNKKDPKTVYIEIGTYIEPSYEMVSYKDAVNKAASEIKRLITDYSKKITLFSNGFIFVFDVPLERIKFGKKTYLSIQIHFKVNQGEGKPVSFKDMAKICLDDEAGLFTTCEIILSKNGYLCHKKKQ